VPDRIGRRYIGGFARILRIEAEKQNVRAIENVCIAQCVIEPIVLL